MLMLVVDVVLVIYIDRLAIYGAHQLDSRLGLLLVFSPFRNTTDTTHCDELRKKEKSVSHSTGDMLYGDIIDM